jgi:hypothetical protein
MLGNWPVIKIAGDFEVLSNRIARGMDGNLKVSLLYQKNKYIDGIIK